VLSILRLSSSNVLVRTWLTYPRGTIDEAGTPREKRPGGLEYGLKCAVRIDGGRVIHHGCGWGRYILSQIQHSMAFSEDECYKYQMIVFALIWIS
jgi:hypothetical protein